VDFWSIFTLFPRLGVRSAIDEGFMYALTAPGRDILNFVKNEGRKTGRASAAYTGSSAAEGPVGSTLRKLFGKGPSSQYLGVDDRNRIIEQIAEQAGVSPAEVQHLVINQAIADRVKIFLPEKLGDEAMQHWNEAMIYNPDILNTMASSVAARSSLGSSFDEVIRNNQINLSELSNALNAVGRKMARKKHEGKNLSEKEIDELVKNEGLKSGTKYEEYAVEKLRDANPEYVTLAHYDNWYIRFATPRQHGRGLKIADDFRVAPAIAFFNHGALKTPENFSKAMDDMYTYLGMKKVDDVWQVTEQNIDAVKKFNSFFGDSVFMRQEGKTDFDIARVH